MTVFRWNSLLAAFALTAMTVAVYWAGLPGGFYFDDEANILVLESVRLEVLNLPNLRDAANSGVAGFGGRPIAQLSFALNHYFSGFDAIAFKATNLAIHLIAGIFVYLVARHLLAARMFAGVAAMLWLLHPLQLTSVLYVVQRMTSLSALFLLAGFLLHMIGRERGGRGGVLMLLGAWSLLWPLSFFSKETGVLFPVLVLAWEVIVRRGTQGRLDGFARLLAAGVGLGFAAGLIYALLPAGQWLWAGYEMRGFTLPERLLTEGRVLWFYLGLIVFPRLEAFGLYHDYMPLSTGLLVPWTTLPAWLGLAGLVWIAWRARHRAPLLAFGIAWFLIGHGMESTVLPLEIAHEHRNYLPSFGIVLIGAWGLMRAMTHNGWPKTLGVALAVVVTGYCALTTALRAHMYGEAIRRTQIEAQHHPESARTHFDAGRALAARGQITADSPQYSFARIHYERAGQFDPNFKMSWLGLIHLNCMVGKSAEAEWIDELARRLRETPFGPGDRNVLYGVKEMSIAGALCLDRGAVEKLFAAASANAAPHTQATLHSWLADYLTLAVRDLTAAQSALDKSLAIVPHNASNRLKRAQLAFLQGHSEVAREMLIHLEGASLVRSERGTRALLLDCLDPGGTERCGLKAAF